MEQQARGQNMEGPYCKLGANPPRRQKLTTGKGWLAGRLRLGDKTSAANQVIIRTALPQSLT